MGQTVSCERSGGVLVRDEMDARDYLYVQSDVNPFKIPSRVLFHVEEDWVPRDAAEVFPPACFAASLAHTIQTRGAGGVTQPPSFDDLGENERNKSPTLRDAMRSVARASVKANGATRMDGLRCERIARPHVRILCELMAMGNVPVIGLVVHEGMVRVEEGQEGEEKGEEKGEKGQRAVAIEACSREELGAVASREAAVVVGYDVRENAVFVRLMSQPEVYVRVSMDALQTGAGIVGDAWVFVRDLDPVGKAIPPEHRDARIDRNHRRA